MVVEVAVHSSQIIAIAMVSCSPVQRVSGSLGNEE